MATRALSQCVACGSEPAGGYCHACGERSRGKPPTLPRFIGELIGEAVVCIAVIQAYRLILFVVAFWTLS